MSDLQSGNTPITSRRRMQVVAEREVPDAAAPEPAGITTTTPTTTSSTLSPAATTISDELIGRQAWRAGVIGSLTVAIRILAARSILLFAVLGAIGLAWLALSAADYVRLVALALYTVSVVCPLIWLASKS